MIEIPLGFFVASFVAGFLTFLAPCTLPLVPAYLAFVGGVSAGAGRGKVLRNALFFILGFSLVFVVFGLLAGGASSAFASYRPLLSQIGGVIVIFFGLYLLGVFNINVLARSLTFKLPSFLTPGSSAAALMLGLSFGFGWSPCIGPILGSILLLAAANSTALIGALLLLIFSVGLAIPFLITALFYTWAERTIAHIASRLGILKFIVGLLLIGIGVLLLSNNFSLITETAYRLLEFIDYDRLLQYL